MNRSPGSLSIVLALSSFALYETRAMIAVFSAHQIALITKGGGETITESSRMLNRDDQHAGIVVHKLWSLAKSSFFDIV